MRAVVQRVSAASVTVDGSEVGACGKGFLVLLGVAPEDTADDAERRLYAARIRGKALPLREIRGCGKRVGNRRPGGTAQDRDQYQPGKDEDHPIG